MDLFTPHGMFFPIVQGRIRPPCHPPNLSIDTVLVNCRSSPGARDALYNLHDRIIISQIGILTYPSEYEGYLKIHVEKLNSPVFKMRRQSTPQCGMTLTSFFFCDPRVNQQGDTAPVEVVYSAHHTGQFVAECGCRLRIFRVRFAVIDLHSAEACMQQSRVFRCICLL